MAKCLYFRQTMANIPAPDQGLQSAVTMASAENQSKNNSTATSSTLEPTSIGSQHQTCDMSTTSNSDTSLAALLTNSPADGSGAIFDLFPDQWEPLLATLNASADSFVDTDSFMKSVEMSDLGQPADELKMESSESRNETDLQTASQTSSDHPTPSNSISSINAGSPRAALVQQFHQQIRLPSPHVDHQKRHHSNNLQNKSNNTNVSDESAYLSEVEASSNCSSVSESGAWARLVQLDPSSVGFGSRPNGPFRSLTTGLEPIPENDVTRSPAVYQPLVPPPVAKPVTTSYNISFPTTLQPRERLDQWFRNRIPKNLNGGNSTSGAASCSSPGAGSSSFPASPASYSNMQSPFHGAKASPNESSEFQPLNVIEESRKKHYKKPRHCPGATYSGKSTPKGFVTDGGNDDDDDEYMMDDSPSRRRHRRKSAGGSGNHSSSGSQMQQSSENRRRDSIKFGLEELQRVLPHIGTPEEEKISQASVLFEGGKYIKNLQSEYNRISEETRDVKRAIDELNNDIEMLQEELPENGAPLIPKVMTMKTLPDMFHDHVIDKTKEDWRYWVFVSIMGHFVHPFDQKVSASSPEDLEKTSQDFIASTMSLQQLRKDAYRKLAKLCAKTSIVESPSKLPEEALSFVTRGERAFKKEGES